MKIRSACILRNKILTIHVGLTKITKAYTLINEGLSLHKNNYFKAYHIISTPVTLLQLQFENGAFQISEFLLLIK